MTGVLVVDDSRFVRTVVGDALTERGFEVATASDGHEAVEMVRTLKPDVVTMDVEMPGMDGIETTERIMAECPTPVVMLAADDAADATLAALASGAVDFVHKAGGQDQIDITDVEDELVRTVEAVAGANPATTAGNGRETGPVADPDAGDDQDSDRETAAVDEAVEGADADGRTDDETPAAETDVDAGASAGETGGGTAAPDVDTEIGVDTEGRGRGVRADVDAGAVATRVAREARDLAGAGPTTTVVIGASTGGPGVVEALLSGLPSGIDARVLVVQHMPASFTGRLAVRLDDVSEYDVREAADRARVGPDEAVLAQGDRHLEVAERSGEALTLRLTEDPPVHNVRPAADVTMESVAATHAGAPLVGGVLTGMGSDGAAGIEAVSEAGGTTIAQDRASSPVFGMPEQAIGTGAVDRVVAAEDLPTAIRDAVRDQQREHRREEAHA